MKKVDFCHWEEILVWSFKQINDASIYLSLFKIKINTKKIPVKII